MTINVPQNVIAPQQANTSSGTANTQRIVTLSDGTFAVIYDAAGVVKFQQFDQFGNKIGVEGTLNLPNSAGGVEMSIVGVEDNKVVIAYETNTDIIRVLSFEILNGVGTQTTDINQDLSISGLNTADIAPSISGSTLDDVAVHALLSASVSGIPIRGLQTFTELNTSTPQNSSVETNFTSGSKQEAALLTNGNRVVVVDTNGQGTATANELAIHIIEPDGTEVVRTFSRPPNVNAIFQPQVEALTGGGFAVAMRTQDGDSDVELQVFDAAGNPVRNTTVVFTNGSDENNDPEIVALDDGGFIIFFDRDNGTSRVMGRRYDEEGNPVGGAFEVDAGSSIGFPVATLLANGLVAVAYSDSATVQVALVGTEALDVVLTDADETITGTIEDDIIDGAGGDDEINGGDGNDTLSGGTGTNTLNGDDGDDTFIGGEGTDTFNGGAGSDTVTYEDSSEAIDVDLFSSNAQSGGDAEGDFFSGVENVIGTNFDDDIDGAVTDNVLSGLDGDDFIAGLGGDDTLDGGDGDDVLRGGSGSDELIGGEGRDTADYTGSIAVTINLATGETSGDEAEGDTLSSIENIIGSGGSDNLTGDDGKNRIAGEGGADTINGGGDGDTLIGGLGADTINGGDGNDFIVGGVSPIDALDPNIQDAANTLNGDAGDDTIFASISGDTIDGGTGNDALNGSLGEDIIDGGDGSDAISGGDGDDTLTGDDGNPLNIHLSNDDFIEGGDGNDTINGGNGRDELFGDDGQDTINGQEGNDEIRGGDGNDTITGGLGRDDIQGGSGDDEIDGDEGDDEIEGGVGNDTLRGGSGDDLITDINGIDTVEGGSGDDRITLQGAGAKNVSGGSGDDVIRIFGGNAANVNTLNGNEGDDTIDGSASIDLISGGEGDDTLFGNAAGDQIFGNSGDDTLNGGDGDDLLDGGSGDDILIGGEGMDVLRGGSGEDQLRGGIGQDTLNGGSGDDGLEGAEGDDTLIGEEGDDQLFGGAGIDTLTGGDDEDLLDGGAGPDILDGGTGTDTADYFGSAAGVTVDLFVQGETIFDGSGGVNGDLSEAFTNVGRGSGGDAEGDVLIGIENVKGSEQNDIITGNFSRNLLDGDDGNDTLDGDFNDDTLIGGSGDDLLIGGQGNDILDGGRGTDTARFGDLRGSFTFSPGWSEGETLVTSSNGEVDRLTNIEFLEFTDGVFTLQEVLASSVPSEGNDFVNGTDGDDTIDTLAGDDVINALAGDDILIGGDGADELRGGEGSDTASYRTSIGGTTARLDAFGDLNTSHAAGDTYDSIENLEGSNFGDLLVGNDGSNILTGGVGADALFGMGGIDTASYHTSAVGVTARLDGMENLNTGDATGDIYDSIENLTGSQFNDLLVGDGNDNVISGLAGGDFLFGFDGNDTLIGGVGPDAFFGGAGRDTADYSASLNGGVRVALDGSQPGANDSAGDSFNGVEDVNGTRSVDFIIGDAGGNILRGLDGDDTIFSQDGADVLFGGQGADMLNGGLGSDVFFYSAANEGGDTIMDFDATDDSEVLFFSGLQTGSFSFLGDASNAFTAGGNTEARFDDATKQLEVDFDGDGASDFELTLTDVALSNLDSGDFTFI